MRKRQRRPPAPAESQGAAQKRRHGRWGARSSPAGVDERRAHRERATFAETLHSKEVCASNLPAAHVARPPTVVWDPAETLALDRLGGDPERPGGSAPTPNASFAPANGPCYAEPYLEQVVKRGALGYGSLHSQPRDGGATTRSVVKDALSETQARVLEEQDTGAQNFVVRVSAILREGAGRPRWTLAEFMGELEHECGERLVHLACVAKKRGAGGAEGLDVTLGYSIDPGARYFIALRWAGLARPEAPGAKWTDVAFHPLRERPTFTRYTCQCAL